MHGMTFDLETWFKVTVTLFIKALSDMGWMYKLTNIVRQQNGALINETLKNNIYHYKAYKQIYP